tara:strand:- start:12794 stop:13408 length:615 start_codon:yes stop_codon:yes gene_type:complete
MSMKPHPIFLTVLAVVAGYIGLFQWTRYTIWTVDLQVETGGILKWYIDTGDGFSEAEGAYAPVSKGGWQTVTVPLPTGSPRKLRLDPVNTESDIIMRSVRWSEPWPGSSGTMDLELAAWENVEVAEVRIGGGVALEPAVESTDVYGIWSESPAHSQTWWRIVRSAGALLIGGVAFVLGTFWNRRVLRIAGEDGNSKGSHPPLAL